jgi:Zn-dependent protease with chaperone function
MAAAKIPYPPSPPDVPEGLTDYPDSFTRQQNLLLAGLFVFLILYIAAVILFAMVGLWCVLTISKYLAAKIIGIILSGTFFLYLVKGFFKSAPINKEMQAEITEEEHPVLFGFIHQLCEELDAPEPNKVFVAPDVNAACISRTSLVNLFVEPKRDLLIGLGLVNCTNLSEFKAVLAHEFGHFCHLGHTSSYTVVVKRIIFDLVEGEDWFDRWIDWFKRQENALWVFGYAVGGCLWLGRQILWWILKTITLQDRAVSREQEFHADLVAVSAAGSDAATHGLLRARFGMQCFMQAVDDLATALDHKLYSNDLYLHQDRAASEVRRKKKEPELGLPPALAHPDAGKDIKVFDAEQDELEDEDDTPPMWRTHPSDADREENAKEQFVAAPIDHRSPWILFANPADLKERLTYKFYRMVFRIPKNAELAEARKVQEYIDNEHAETTYDPKYHGAYDDRPLEPGDLDELNTVIRDQPWTEDRMERVLDKLYDGCRENAEARADMFKDLAALKENVVGRPSPKMKRKIEEAEKKLDENWEWFKSFDRRVYLLHVQMAAAVNREWKRELVERYQFQREVQRLYEEARNTQEEAFACAKELFNSAPNEVHPDFLSEVMQVLRTSWRSLKKILQDAKEINLPAMKNFEEGENLASFILPEKMVPEPPLSYVKGTWCQKLVDQLGSVRSKCFRLHFKSVGGILALQERIAAAWKEARAPIPAEIVEPEALLAAEAIPAEVVVEGLVDESPVQEAVLVGEVVPAEVAVESFVEALPVDDLAEPPPLVSGPAAREPAGVPMAAFVSAAPTPTSSPAPRVAAVDAPPIVVAPTVESIAEEPPPLPPPAPPVAEPTVSFDVAPSALAHPPGQSEAAVEEATFSLDLDAARPSEPPPGETIFSLDADEIAAAHAPKPPAAAPAPLAPPAAAVPAEEIFSLDAAAAAPADDVISLDAGAIVIDVEPIDEEPVMAELLDEPSLGSGSVPAPAARPAPGTGSSASMPALGAATGAGKNGVRKRPPVKITLVRPGQKSPFA